MSTRIQTVLGLIFYPLLFAALWVGSGSLRWTAGSLAGGVVFLMCFLWLSDNRQAASPANAYFHPAFVAYMCGLAMTAAVVFLFRARK